MTSFDEALADIGSNSFTGVPSAHSLQASPAELAHTEAGMLYTEFIRTESHRLVDAVVTDQSASNLLEPETFYKTSIFSLMPSHLFHTGSSESSIRHIYSTSERRSVSEDELLSELNNEHFVDRLMSSEHIYSEVTTTEDVDGSLTETDVLVILRTPTISHSQLIELPAISITINRTAILGTSGATKELGTSLLAFNSQLITNNPEVPTPTAGNNLQVSSSVAGFGESPLLLEETLLPEADTTAGLSTIHQMSSTIFSTAFTTTTAAIFPPAFTSFSPALTTMTASKEVSTTNSMLLQLSSNSSRSFGATSSREELEQGIEAAYTTALDLEAAPSVMTSKVSRHVLVFFY